MSLDRDPSQRRPGGRQRIGVGGWWVLAAVAILIVIGVGWAAGRGWGTRGSHTGAAESTAVAPGSAGAESGVGR